MKKDLTELIFILDMSGSMAHLTDDTIGGFNSVLKEHANKEGEVLVTTYLFNNDSRMLHDRLPIKDVPAMTDKDYRAGGCTALIDAMGDAIKHIVGIHRYARPEDIPEHTIFVITTDGMENASRRYTKAEVRAMVERQKALYGWEFLFLGANMDAIAAAEGIGIRRDRAVKYVQDSVGLELNSRVVSDTLCNLRMNRPVTASWKADIEADEQTRG